MNSAKKGKVRCIVFKEVDTWYGVALEFNLVEEGDDAEVVNFNLQEAIRGYVNSQKKIGGSRVAPLNQKGDLEYEKLWSDLSSDKPVPAPLEVKYYGFTNV